MRQTRRGEQTNVSFLLRPPPRTRHHRPPRPLPHRQRPRPFLDLVPRIPYRPSDRNIPPAPIPPPPQLPQLQIRPAHIHARQSTAPPRVPRVSSSGLTRAILLTPNRFLFSSPSLRHSV